MTLRDNTERPEIVDVGANVMVGCDGERMVEGVRKMMGNGDAKMVGCALNPYGDGKAGENIINIVS